MPPSNVTVNCDKKENDCIIQWERPQISHSDKDRCFKYEVKITYKVRGEFLDLRLTLIHTLYFLLHLGKKKISLFYTVQPSSYVAPYFFVVVPFSVVTELKKVTYFNETCQNYPGLDLFQQRLYLFETVELGCKYWMEKWTSS